MNNRAISKYTKAGLAARANAIVNQQPIVIRHFKISDVAIDLTDSKNVIDIENPWIEKTITGMRIIPTEEESIVELELSVLQHEAVNHGRSMCIYLEDGTPYIVGTPPNDYNPGLEQRYLVQITMVNADIDSYDFKYIPNNNIAVKHEICEYSQSTGVSDACGVVVRFGEVDNAYVKENSKIDDF